MKTLRYASLKDMKLIPTEKEPGAFIHLTRFELRALYKALEHALHGAPRLEPNSTLQDNERDTLVALRTQILRLEKGESK